MLHVRFIHIFGSQINHLSGDHALTTSRLGQCLNQPHPDTGITVAIFVGQNFESQGHNVI